MEAVVVAGVVGAIAEKRNRTMLDKKSLTVIIEELSNIASVKSKGKEIEPNPTYSVTVDLLEQVRVHSQLSTFPAKLISDNAPNETEAEFNYKQRTYQPTTRPIWKEATTQINRIFNKQNYSVKGWGNNEGVYENEPAEQYFFEDYPGHRDIMSYFETVIKPAKDEDPNALLCLDLKDTQFPDTELPQPIMKLYYCDKVMMNNEAFAVVLTDERSVVEFANSEERTGLVFKLYDNEMIYRVVQYGEKKDFLFNVEEYYRHDLGYVPAELLKGQPKSDHGLEYYESLFMDAVPMLNDVTIDTTNLRVNKVSNLSMDRDWETPLR